MLTRIYATAFAKQEDLDAYLQQLEEAEKRDHRRLGREMDLFHFQEEGPGVVFWHPKGWTMFQELIAYMRRRLTRGLRGGQRAADARQGAVGDLGPLGLVPREHVREVAQSDRRTEDERVFALKPMNCPGHIQIFKHGLKSLSRPAAAARRVRRGAPLRAVRARCTG